MRRSSRAECRVRLFVEQLEDRSLMDAGGAAALMDPGNILVGFAVAGGKVEVREVAVEDGQSVASAIAAQQGAAGVVFAEPNFLVQAAVIPSDSSFGSLYGLHNTGQSGGTADADIDAPEAWDTTKGSLKNVVAIIDTGIDHAHQDLYKNIWINQGEIPDAILATLDDVDADGLITFWILNDAANFGGGEGGGSVEDVNGNGYIDGADLLASTEIGGWADELSNDGDSFVDDIIGWDFVNGDNDPLDDHDHGTHVAGTIGAMGDNSLGVVGVNWKVQMMGLKFLSAAGSGSIDDARLALDYAVAHGAQISNNSWGGGGYSDAFFLSLDAARAAGHIFVAAAGNAASDNDLVSAYPASYSLDNVVAVAATDRADALASFSSYGASSVDLGAPGVSILSTTIGDTYSTFNGTSMATPHVAGALALLRASNDTLSYSQLISRTLANVDLVSALADKTDTGGRLNVYNAIQNLAGDVAGGPRVVSAVANSTTSVSSVRLTFSEAIDPATFTKSDITSFRSPSGSSITVSSVAVVAGSGNKQFDVKFSAKTAAGTYTFKVGPNIKDAAGNLMDQDQDGVLGESTQDRFSASFVVNAVSTFSKTSNAAIPDLGTLTSTITISQDMTIADLNVKVTATHTWDSDLLLILRGPDGTEVTLFNRRGGSGDNLTGTTFNDEAATAIASGAAPFSGSYRPEQALSAFDGKNAKGTWSLIVQDLAAADVGVLKSWSLTVEKSSSTAAQAASDEARLPDLDAAPVSAATSAPVASDNLSSVSLALGTSPARRGAEHVALREPLRTAAADQVFRQASFGRAAGNLHALSPLHERTESTLEELLAFFEAGMD